MGLLSEYNDDGVFAGQYYEITEKGRMWTCPFCGEHFEDDDLETVVLTTAELISMTDWPQEFLDAVGTGGIELPADHIC